MNTQEKTRLVPQGGAHKIKHQAKGGDGIVEYAATYTIGNATVHIIAPPELTPEEEEKILDDYHKAGWQIILEIMEKAKRENE